MPRKNTPASTIDRYTYTPGDGHRYAWRGPVIVVERIRRVDPEGLAFEPTGDTIPVPAVITVTALTAAVDAWRSR